MSLLESSDSSALNATALHLPVPGRSRWQPLRIGLVELFHYEQEEFWFHDGHLLLRGNNGTGKSKVLSLTLPFLLDASLSPSRVEPDGDRMKRMEWNLLLGRYDRRVGYTWVEFGRLADDGAPEFVTLGCGLQAVAGRGRVDPWYFITDQRVGESLHLIGDERTVVSRDRLQEMLNGRGQLFQTAEEYRRNVDARLFRLGDRYSALMDTLIQLRQPQLSKKPDEQSLSEALSNALPELPGAVLEDVAEAMNQLDEYRAELGQIEQLRSAISQFGRRYRLYAQVQARRQARYVRKAQTEVDSQSRSLNATRERLEQAREAVRAHEVRCAELDLELRRQRAIRDELKSDPAMSDARRLDDLTRAWESAERELSLAVRRLESARARLAHERADVARREHEAQAAQLRADASAAEARGHASEAGVLNEHEQAVASIEPGGSPDFELVERDMLAAAARRGQQIARLRKLIAASADAERTRDATESRCADRRAMHERAETAALQAYQALQASGTRLLQAWRTYLSGLQVLTMPEPEATLAEVADWVEAPEVAPPMQSRLDAAVRAVDEALASEKSVLAQGRAQVEQEDGALCAEQVQLTAGRQLSPVASHTREVAARDGRAGAPLWNLLEYRDHVSADERAGLEAALAGAGLLDAWVTPAGALLHPDTRDASLHIGTPCASSLLGWLAPQPNSEVGEPALSALLSSISCSADDAHEGDTWLSPTGRFRVGRLAGAFQKTCAEYVGAAAREGARLARLGQIAARRTELEAALATLTLASEAIRRRQQRLAEERASAPGDDEVRLGHVRYTGFEGQRREAQDRLREADAELERAARAFREALHALETDACDLKLPVEPSALLTVERAVSAYRAAAQSVRHAFDQHARSRAELGEQRVREQAADGALRESEESARAREHERDDVGARLTLLRQTALEAVTDLQRRLALTQAELDRCDQALELHRTALSSAGEERARCAQRLDDEQTALDERSAARRYAVERLGGFAATGLLAIALSEREETAFTGLGLDATIQLARRIEQAFTQVAAEDQDWARIQSDISRDYTTLGQALSALGQKAQMEQSDFGLVVHVVYRNRPEGLNQLEFVLGLEVEQRRGILSAREREILENHLQAEVAVHLQRLLDEAESRVERINEELKRRPTSTGVYFRLDWEPLAEGSAGAPVGLAAARARLLRRSADAWSAEDRRLVGEFLSARIASERAGDETGPLAEHLGLALDYRRWHRFRVKRWHDGAFRPLSGPASSGERALGLTVPLFAAASSHYASAGSPHAPRLVLLDEAFAGIDDEARAHCMALIREFDLDFVMTSEREWGCYATLPGVSICQVVRRDGVDAVFVSRWTWDGRVRRPVPAVDARPSHVGAP